MSPKGRAKSLLRLLARKRADQGQNRRLKSRKATPQSHGRPESPGNETDGAQMSTQQNTDSPEAAEKDSIRPATVEGRGAETVADTRGGEHATDLVALLKKAEDEAAELRDAFLRARADTDNVRKQAAADLARAHKYAIERFAGELLAVKDSLESALTAENASPEAVRSGVELTLKQLEAAFQKSQITEIEAAGKKFDPNRHQAMAMVDSPEPPNTVAQVFQKGYLLNDRVLRPAMVAVSKPK